MAIRHSTPADSSFSAQGKRVWEEDHTGDASDLSFVQFGIGAVTTETVQAALRRMVFSGQYDTAGHFNTANDALTDTLGIAKVQFAAPTINSETIIMRWRTADTLAGDFTFMLDDNGVVSGDRDNIFSLGYNLAGAQVQELANEPAWGWTIESHWNTGVSHLMEMHFQGAHTDGTAFRNYSATVNRTTKAVSQTFASDLFALSDITFAYNYLSVATTASSAVISLNGASTELARQTNNVKWLSQLNAAAGATVEIARVDASDQVFIAPAGSNVNTGGVVGVGGSANTIRALTVAAAMTGTSQSCVSAISSFSSAATAGGYGFKTGLATANAIFTMTEAIGFHAQDISKGGSATITTQEGFRAQDLTVGTNNYAFRGLVSSGANKYNLRMDGTAANYLLGVTGIGVDASSTAALILAAGTTGVSSLRVPHGSAPSSPVNGDIWTTTSGLFVRINGGTVGPLT